MKRIFAAILVFTLAAVIMCSCGESGGSQTESKTSDVSATESDKTEGSEATEAESTASSASKVDADAGAFEGDWVSVIDPSKALGYDSVSLKITSGGFVLTMTKDEMAEVSDGIYEEDNSGALICYCTKITTRNTAENTVEDEVVISESEREDAKMTVEMLENGHIAATNYSGSTIEFEKK